MPYSVYHTEAVPGEVVGKAIDFLEATYTPDEIDVAYLDVRDREVILTVWEINARGSQNRESHYNLSHLISY